MKSSRVVVGCAAVLDRRLRQMPGRFDELHIVERDEGLQRRVGALAADACRFRDWER